MDRDSANGAQNTQLGRRPKNKERLKEPKRERPGDPAKCLWSARGVEPWLVGGGGGGEGYGGEGGGGRGYGKRSGRTWLPSSRRYWAQLMLKASAVVASYGGCHRVDQLKDSAQLEDSRILQLNRIS
ncbi:hypothetical protein NHX12_032130 [Muraenolepis orangiensis]|uniref:Uncharacterized protein n=1 Tax=Muraenolepis orangiensis TaxID=630683 RepID=A0A9Q0EAX9_9TELE|nr:hypothetical protein NHX12_032130 [Muraenolepis orangiensis]